MLLDHETIIFQCSINQCNVQVINQSVACSINAINVQSRECSINVINVQSRECSINHHSIGYFNESTNRSMSNASRNDCSINQSTSHSIFSINQYFDQSIHQWMLNNRSILINECQLNKPNCWPQIWNATNLRQA